MSLKVGDRVKCVSGIYSPKEGKIGTIKRVGDVVGDDVITVEFDENINGHQGYGGTCKNGHGWNFFTSGSNSVKNLKLIESNNTDTLWKRFTGIF